MATQDTYLDNLRPGVAGQIVDMSPRSLMSRTVEDAAGIAFGKPVEQGAAAEGCKIFDGGTILGITVRERSLIAGNDKFAQYDSARIMAGLGTVWVIATVDVLVGDPVYVRPSNATFQKDNTNSGVLLPNARYDSAASAGGVVKVRLGAA